MINYLLVPLTHGPWVALGSALLVTPIGLILIAGVFERRLLRPREQYFAFILGDPLLATAVAAFVSINTPKVLASSNVTRPVVLDLVAAVWLTFGLWQWKHEIHRGAYNTAQALSPSKIWHQLIIYPLLGVWLWSAILTSAPHWAAHPLPAGAAICCLATWAMLLAYDSSHIKLGHAPYDWHHLRQAPKPWDADSTTLRAHGLNNPEAVTAGDVEKPLFSAGGCTGGLVS